MSNPMNYRGQHRKYVEGTSQYEVYYYGDVVQRNSVSYVCKVESTKGYIPEEADSGFVVLGDGVGITSGLGIDIDGGSY
jgi:hypothetical protein